MRNVSGRKVLSAAKQIFYFFHTKSSISATSHPSSSCQEEWVRPVPKSPAGYCLFSTKTGWNFTVIRAVSVALWVDTILRLWHTCPSCCRQPSNSALATRAFPTFCSIWYPFPGSVFTKSHFCYFAFSISCHLLMIQSLSISCIPSFLFIGIGDHKSSFQSLNKDLACGEIDSYYPVLRKNFHQGKPIISLTVIPHRNRSHHHHQVTKLPRERWHLCPSFTVTKKFQTCL